VFTCFLNCANYTRSATQGELLLKVINDYDYHLDSFKRAEMVHAIATHFEQVFVVSHIEAFLKCVSSTSPLSTPAILIVRNTADPCR
jgi:hypothetical protein